MNVMNMIREKKEKFRQYQDNKRAINLIDAKRKGYQLQQERERLEAEVNTTKSNDREQAKINALKEQRGGFLRDLGLGASKKLETNKSAKTRSSVSFGNNLFTQKNSDNPFTTSGKSPYDFSNKKNQSNAFTLGSRNPYDFSNKTIKKSKPKSKTITIRFK